MTETPKILATSGSVNFSRNKKWICSGFTQTQGCPGQPTRHKELSLTASICYSTFWSGVAGLSAGHPRADKPQHHDKRWNKMLITVDWSLLGNLRAREGGAVKFFQIRQALASARVKLGERRCLETLWRTEGEAE